MDSNVAKGICLAGFFLVTMILGSLPLCLITKFRVSLKESCRGQFVLSILNCFAGGVFLGTCLLNMLTEGEEQFEEYKEVAGFDNEYPFFQASIGIGFFLIVLIDRIVHLQATRKSSRRVAEDPGKVSRKLSSCDQIVSEKSPTGVELVCVTNRNAGAEDAVPVEVHTTDAAGDKTVTNGLGAGELADFSQPNQQVWSTNSKRTSISNVTNMNEQVMGEATSAQSKDNINHGKNGAITNGDARQGGAVSGRGTDGSGHEEESTFSDMSTMPLLRVILLLGALSFHTIFDGLAVGLQETEAGIWTTFLGISIHKAIVAVCLGLELTTALQDKPLRVILSMFFFALMAPMGVGIGMGVTSGGVDMQAQLLSASILQAVATGSFLYVTFMEVLGPELRTPHHGVLKVLVATFGFLVAAGAKVLDAD